jgi:hypothetical protein
MGMQHGQTALISSMHINTQKFRTDMQHEQGTWKSSRDMQQESGFQV